MNKRNRRRDNELSSAAVAAREGPILNPWLNLAMLAAESQQVIWLRLMKLSAGGAPARAEANRMTSEKMLAAAQAMSRVMLGDSPDRVVSHYRRKVRANARRLSR